MQIMVNDILAGTKWGCSRRVLNTTYTMYIQPNLLYCSEALITAANANINKLEQIQNQALRLITGAVKSTPIDAMLALTRIPSITTKIEEQALLKHEKMLRLPNSKWKEKNLPTALLKTQSSFLEKVTKIKSKLNIPNTRENPLELLQPTSSLELSEKISKSDTSKEMQKLLTLETINTRYPTEEWLHIYTDGSTKENLTGAGVTCTHFSFYQSLGTDTTNYDGEIEAIYIALRQLMNLPLNKFNKAVILSDSKAAIQAICSNATKKSTKIRECYKMLIQLQKINKIVHLQWIPAHCGVVGNETADMLAKKGTTIKQKSQFNFSYSSIKRLITRKFSHSYLQEIATNSKDKKWITLLSNPDIIPQTPRKTAVAAFRLLTNHDCLASHLYRIGISAAPLCVLCKDPAEMNEDHLKTCEALRSEETIVQKYWKARMLMASLPNARH